MIIFAVHMHDPFVVRKCYLLCADHSTLTDSV